MTMPMNALSCYLKRPPPIPVSRRSATAGLAGLAILAVMVIGHMVALSVFMWEATTSSGGPIALLVLLGISVVAISFIWRGARFLLRH